MAGSETGVDPLFVIVEVELRLSHQEIGWAKPFKRGEPTFSTRQIIPKCRDVLRFGSDHAPPEQANSLFHIVIVFSPLSPPRWPMPSARSKSRRERPASRST